MRQVAQVVLKRGEPGDCFSPDLEGWESVGDPLLGLGEDIEDRLAQLSQRCALRLLQSIQILVDFLSRHGFIVLIDEPHEQAAQPAQGTSPLTGHRPKPLQAEVHVIAPPCSFAILI